MKALISPNEAPIYYVSKWVKNAEGYYVPSEYTAYPNSCRVAQVEPDANIFAVAEPLFWATCPEDCVADQWWYNTQTNTFAPIENAPLPT